jgi:hypothetical protein
MGFGAALPAAGELVVDQCGHRRVGDAGAVVATFGMRLGATGTPGPPAPYVFMRILSRLSSLTPIRQLACAQ